MMPQLAPVFLAAVLAGADPADDPLPPGALARLGSLYLRHPGMMDLRFSPDGKTVRGVVASPAVMEWDAASGRRLRSTPLPGEKYRHVSVSADGSTAVLTDFGRPPWVVAVGTGAVRFTLPAGSDITQITHPLSPDGRLLAAFDRPHGGLVPQTVQLWDTVTGKARALGRQGDVLCQAAFTPDGARLLAHSGRAATCWDVATGRQLWQRDAVPLSGDPVAFSPDGARVAVGLCGRRVEVWEATTGITVGVQPPAGVATPAGFTADGAAVLVAAGPFGAFDLGSGWGLWDLAAGEYRVTVPGANRAAVAPDGRTVWTAPDHILRRWDVATRRQLAPDPWEYGHIGRVNSLAFSPAGDRVVTVADEDDRSLRVWDPRSGRLVATHPIPTDVSGWWKDARFTGDGRKVVLGECEQELLNDHIAARIVVLDPVSGKWERTMSRRFDRGPKDLHFSFAPTADARQARLLRVQRHGDTDKYTAKLLVWDIPSGAPQPDVSLAIPGTKILRPDGGLDPSGRWAVVGRWVADVRPGGRVVELEATEAGKVFHPMFSPDGHYVALADFERSSASRPTCRARPATFGGVGVWDTATGRLLGQFPRTEWLFYQPTLDGLFVVAESEGEVEVWEVGSGRRVLKRDLVGYDPALFYLSLAVAPDGRVVVTTPHDETQALVWDLTVPPVDLTPAKCWEALGGSDAARAYAAVWRLAAGPDRGVVPLLRDRLRTAPPDAARVSRLIAALDASVFSDREGAEKELAGLGSAAGAAVRTALAETRSAEARARLGRLAARLAGPALPPDALRMVRAVAALERLGTTEARGLLKELADRPDGVAAKAALARLSSRR